MKHRILLVLSCTGAMAAAFIGGVAVADDDFVRAVLGLVTNRSPEVRIAKPDRDRLSVRRIDVVDAKGVIRMTLAGDLPNPVLDGVEYKRQRPTGGLILRDDQGNERGGIAYTPGFGAVMGLDHNNGEAAGFLVRNTGDMSLSFQQKGPERRAPEIAGHMLPDPGAPSPVNVTVGKDGEPRLSLSDKQDRPRLVFTVTPEGFGAVQFLDAKGQVVNELVPERGRSGN